MPESFNVLVKEIRSLGIDIELERVMAEFVSARRAHAKEPWAKPHWQTRSHRLVEVQ